MCLMTFTSGSGSGSVTSVMRWPRSPESSAARTSSSTMCLPRAPLMIVAPCAAVSSHAPMSDKGLLQGLSFGARPLASTHSANGSHLRQPRQQRGIDDAFRLRRQWQQAHLQQPPKRIERNEICNTKPGFAQFAEKVRSYQIFALRHKLLQRVMSEKRPAAGKAIFVLISRLNHPYCR